MSLLNLKTNYQKKIESKFAEPEMVNIIQPKKEKAIKYYEKVIQLKPNHGDVYCNLGILFNSLGKYQKAVNCFQKTIQINPNNLKNYNILGTILIELGEYEKAINCYEKAIKIEPNNINTINGLVDLFSSIQLSNLNENNNKNLCKRCQSVVENE